MPASLADRIADGEPPLAARPTPDIRRGRARPLTRLGRYAASLLLVAAATLLAYAAHGLVAAADLTIVYVLPVVIAAGAFGWGPALAATAGGVLAFDFFFTPPYFSLQIDSASDIWAAGLLLVIAGIVATVAASARSRALEAQRASERAEALRSLAHLIIAQRPQDEVLDAAARALHRIFGAPAVVFLDGPGGLRLAAAAGGPAVTPLDEEAARGAIAVQLHTLAETYPYDQAEFEFWPATTPSGRRYAIGVDFARAGRERPEAPERFTEPVAAYLSAALNEAGRARA